MCACVPSRCVGVLGNFACPRYAVPCVGVFPYVSHARAPVCTEPCTGLATVTSRTDDLYNLSLCFIARACFIAPGPSSVVMSGAFRFLGRVTVYTSVLALSRFTCDPGLHEICKERSASRMCVCVCVCVCHVLRLCYEPTESHPDSHIHREPTACKETRHTMLLSAVLLCHAECDTGVRMRYLTPDDNCPWRK